MMTEHKAATQLSHNQHFNVPHFLLLLYNCCTIEKVCFQFQIEAPKNFFHLTRLYPVLHFYISSKYPKWIKLKNCFIR